MFRIIQAKIPNNAYGKQKEKYKINYTIYTTWWVEHIKWCRKIKYYPKITEREVNTVY